MSLVQDGGVIDSREMVGSSVIIMGSGGWLPPAIASGILEQFTGKRTGGKATHEEELEKKRAIGNCVGMDGQIQ